ncbi:haloacid dehalogenase, partial [Streptomyces sp. sk2.1]
MLQGIVEGHAVLVGREQLLADAGIALPSTLSDAVADAATRGRTSIVVAR